MALSDVDNAMRLAAQAWATANGLAFRWDNTPAQSITQKTLAYAFRPFEGGRLTGATVRTSGTVVAALYVPAGTGIIDGLTLGESLLAAFKGQVFAGADVLDEASVARVGREGANYRIDVVIPWEFDETRVPQGAVGPHQTPGMLVAYQAFRARYEAKVRAPLALKTFFDNSPVEENEPPPWAIATFRTLQPLPVELRTLRVPGRVIVAFNYPLGTGVAACEVAISTVVRAFDECSFSGVTFGTPVVNRVGRTPKETWQANVRLPFHYEVRI